MIDFYVSVLAAFLLTIIVLGIVALIVAAAYWLIKGDY